jgi:TolB-like protein/Tfp pilus assembly protein PilF
MSEGAQPEQQGTAEASAANPGQSVQSERTTFISYASADKATADSIVAALERAGIGCWIAPRDVLPGVFYADAIVQAINAARVLIVLLSADSVSSQHVLREVERASSKKRPLVALRLDRAPLPTGLEYFLSASHWLDASGSTVPAALPQLIAAVRQLLAQHAAPGTASPASAPPEPALALDFPTRLKESKVAQWTVAYAAFAFAALRGVALLIDAFALPHELLRSSTIAMLVGLPLVSILAWYHGARALKRITGSELLLIGLLLVVGGGLLWLIPRPSAERAEASAAKQTNSAVAPVTPPAAASVAVPEKSVAVLPFVDMSEKKDQEYFSDGLSEEVIDKLTNAADLKVIARTSSFQFKGKNEDMRTIGQRLGVANLLEGSVRKSGNALRITVQLVRADTGYHVWSETYDRNADDIFKVQDEIAAAVLQALKASLLRGSTSTPTGTRNLEAYNLYLQAHAIYRRASTALEYKTAIEYLRSAVEADPDYAQAWALLSAALSEQGEGGYVPRDSATRESRRAAERALELGPDLADAHVSMARFLIVDELNLLGGEREVRRALELEPNNQWALAWAGLLASFRGQFLDAATFLQKAIASDPINPDRYHDLAQNYYFSGNYSEAMNTFRKVLDLFPLITDKHIFPGTVMLAQGKAQSALREIDRESDEKIRLRFNCRVLALDALGRKVEADSALTYLIRNYSGDHAYEIGVVYASRRNLDEALIWFERSFRQHEPRLLYAKIDPFLRNVQSDSRFNALLKRLGLVG